MADNVTITSGTGVTIAADDDGSALHQWVKIEFGDNNSFNTVTTATGLPVQVLSMPPLPIVRVSGTTIAITSLPDLGLGSSVKISSLPPLGTGILSINNFTFVPTITNLASNPLTVSGTTIAITSLPPLGAAIVSVNNFTFVLSITNLSTVPLTVSGTTIAITSLPDLGLNSSVKVSSLPPFPLVSNPWSYTSTYTSAQTNVPLLACPGDASAAGSLTAYYITDVMFANSGTEGNLSLIESRSNGAIKVKMETIYFRPYGGAIINLGTPIVLDTNAALCMTSRSVTSHSLTITGYRK